MADRVRPQSPSSSPSPSRKTRRRAALIALAAVMSLAAVADSVAQVRGGFGGRINAGISRGPTGPGIRTPDGPRGPGIGRPRFPGGIMVPPGFGPRGPVIIETADDTPPRRVTGARQARPQKQTKQAPRRGFDAPAAGETRFVANEVLLTIGAGVSTATLDTMARRQRLTRMESQEFALTGQKLFRWRINDGRPVATVIRTLMADARILAVQPNYVYTLQGDTEARTQSDGAQYALAKLRLPQAHAISKGEGVTVAVIDTAIDAAHPELAGAIAKTFVATGAPEKPQPHGTAMAGAIAAHGKLTGAAPDVKLLAVQAFSAAKSEGTSFGILKGLAWAADEGANVVNMSFAGPADPAVQAMLGAARAKGIVLIAAAGNAGPRARPLYPAADPNVIAVTATDSEDRLFDRANRGTHIAVAAPGVDILVAAPDGGYTQTSGTSVASAEVTGIAALMIARDRTLDPAAVRKLLMATARDLGPAGPDDQFGAGLADALAALGPPGKPTDVSRAGATP